MTVPLSLARRSVVHGAGAPAADVPLNGAATWDPANGLRLWDALDQAALWVVGNAGARIVAVGLAVGGLSVAEEARLLAEARAILCRPGIECGIAGCPNCSRVPDAKVYAESLAALAAVTVR